jgi:ABC-2 type transport system ATP-binding protein
MVHLGDHADSLVDRLSGGQRARVSLASALLGDADVLILDEPTVGLDPLLRRDLWAIFHQLADAGKTLLISSHVLDEARRCDYLILLREGKILATGSPDELRQRTGCDDAEQMVIQLIENGLGAQQ